MGSFNIATKKVKTIARRCGRAWGFKEIAAGNLQIVLHFDCK